MVRIGLLGAGGMGRQLAQVAQELPDCRVTYVCDPNEDAATQAGQALEAAVSESAADLLGREDVDAVIIAAPNHLHAELAIAAAHAGKHIFCEKPMALRVAEAQAMIAAAEAGGVKLMIGQVLRYVWPFVWMREFLAEGSLGAPFAVQITRIGGPWGGEHSQDWRLRGAQCGGPLYEIGAHEIDFLRCLLGEATSVYARFGHFLPSATDYEDLTSVIIDFAGGQTAQLLEGHASHMSLYDGKIFGAEGTLIFRGWGEDLAYQRRGEAEPVRVDRAQFAGQYEEGVHREVREFVEAIRDDTAPPIPGIEGLRNVEIAEAAALSAQRGTPVALPL